MTSITLGSTAVAIYKSIVDLIYVNQYLWLPVISTSQFYDSSYSTTSPYSCNASVTAAVFAFISQMCLLGNQLCFLIISIDLRYAYTNPFTSFKHNRPRYAFFVVVWSIFNACILMALGNNVYGLSSLGLVWIQDDRVLAFPNTPKIYLFYAKGAVVFAYAIWVHFLFSRTSVQGLPETLSKRASIIERSRKYVAGYIFYNLLLYAFQSASFFLQVEPGQTTVISSMAATLMAFSGVWSLLVVIYANYSELTWANLRPDKWHHKDDVAENVALEGLLLQPHLNIALRAEILFFTTQGITFAARELLRHQARLLRRSATAELTAEALQALPMDRKDLLAEDLLRNSTFSISSDAIALG